jgi:flavorubredoxin
MTAFSAVPVAENVFWVGAIDWSLREFHGYNTGRGTTYNAYLVLADKITLIDTVKRPFFNEMMERIASVCGSGKNRIHRLEPREMDHSGCLPEAVRAIRTRRFLPPHRAVKALQNTSAPSRN